MCFLSIAFVLEYAVGGTVSVPLGSVLVAMISIHLFIGLGEGIITALIVSLLLRVRSDLVYVNSNKNNSNNLSTSYGIFILLILSLTLITPYASSSPDGLESVASEFGFEETDGIVLLLEDYGISSINNNFVSTVASALLGVLAIAGFSTLFLRKKSGKKLINFFLIFCKIFYILKLTFCEENLFRGSLQEGLEITLEAS